MMLVDEEAEGGRYRGAARPGSGAIARRGGMVSLRDDALVKAAWA